MKNEIQSGISAAETFLIFNGVVLFVTGVVLFEEIGPFSALIPIVMLGVSFFVYRKLKDASFMLDSLEFPATDQDK